MTMLDVHREAMETVNEAVHTFFLRYNAPALTVYGFVEGKEDPMFYRNLIERFLPDDWTIEFIRSGRKIKVIEAFDSFDWKKFDPRRICFFLDRDLDHLARPNYLRTAENVYLTDGYSVENSIVEDRMFMRLLSEGFNIIDLSPNEESALIASFGESLGVFREKLAPIMALVLHWRRTGVVAHLNNLDLRLLFRFEDGSVVCANGSTTDEERLKVCSESIGAPLAEPAEYAQARADFDEAAGSGSFTRGKYLVWFLAHFLTHVHREIVRFSEAYKHPPKPKVELGPGNLMFNAAPRARCPVSLREFIERNFLGFIADRVTSAC